MLRHAGRATDRHHYSASKSQRLHVLAARIPIEKIVAAIGELLVLLGLLLRRGSKHSKLPVAFVLLQRFSYAWIIVLDIVDPLIGTPRLHQVGIEGAK